MKSNWTDNLTPKEQDQWYHEIVEYFTDDVIKEMSEKCDNVLDTNPSIV
jgi:hypothetical protein